MVEHCVGSSLIGIYLRVTHFFTKKGPSLRSDPVSEKAEEGLIL